MDDAPSNALNPDATGDAHGGDCVIPPTLPYDVLRGLVVNRDPFNEDEIRAYAESQSNGEQVVHLEMVKTEFVFARRHDVWDVHMTDGRWWVITSPTNLYPQGLFPSLDYCLSLHIGVTARVLARHDTDATPTESMLFAGAFRRWEQATNALERGPMKPRTFRPWAITAVWPSSN